MLERQESTTESRGIVVVEPRVLLSACGHVRVFLGLRAHPCVHTEEVCKKQRQGERNRNEKFLFEGKSQKLHPFKNTLPLSPINIAT